ncbi:MAG: efflux RND transporter periplasmic adaptor subunit [Firmicutes bacterium]|uniref:Efflux RND transporter periplasmic adaptor subunit n=1 Tax=Sphingobacterium litopenaei TaxID=2763500 RepID=A0ABR7YAJ3_9SPHI|nr:efflux RND transporter periplasmic adaptor subunit [Sphingobacterium litopenaei]MBD1428328.1 efflux RND transporter periplasmic adaptor subunit [Sphingobacterium litopenaei]MCK9480016.1 efflux RND transporter periplasmic adaptor subunit [Bacillota bacterium]
MKRIINNIVFSVLVLVAFFAFNACTNNHKEGDGHNHGTEAETTTDEHEEENVAVLTDEQMKAVGIEIGMIEQKQLSATLKANGGLRVPNSNKANATSMFGGVIKSLNVEIGDFVKKGQVIGTISNPQFIQLQEEYLSINSRIEFAEQEVARQRELNEGNAGAKKNLQSATSELNTLRTRKASLQQQIQMMGINPASLSNASLKSSLVVTSPISGTISNVFAKIGSYVDVSSPIAEIIENTALHLDLQVYEKDIPLIKIGQKIDFVVTNNPNKTYSAEVYSIGSSFSGESKTIAVHSRITGDKTGLIDGMSITGMVSLDDVLSTAVPNDAIVNADGKYYIFLVKEQEEEPHEHKEGEAHDHDEEEAHDHGSEKGTRFVRMEVIKGASLLGYTAITPVSEIPHGTHIVVKSAFFVNAKMDDSGEHAHAH